MFDIKSNIFLTKKNCSRWKRMCEWRKCV